jgi:lipoprotein-anchoring transpeptidase ErfK/SrfK
VLKRGHHLNRYSITAGIAVLLLFLAACGGDDGGGDERGDGGEPRSSEETEDAAAPSLPPGNTWSAEAKDGLTEVEVYDQADPAEGTEPIERLAHPINPQGTPLTFLVDGADISGDYIPVYLPVPPNGSRGWVRKGDVTLQPNPYHVKIELGAHKLTVTNAGNPHSETSVGVGNIEAQMGTPTGLYYIKELIDVVNPDGPYGPFAYGISGFSTNPEVIEQFGDGGVVGIHGTNDPSSIGSNVSHGCIRVPNDFITQMTTYIPFGTPVEIVA